MCTSNTFLRGYNCFDIQKKIVNRNKWNRQIHVFIAMFWKMLAPVDSIRCEVGHTISWRKMCTDDRVGPKINSEQYGIFFEKNTIQSIDVSKSGLQAKSLGFEKYFSLPIFYTLGLYLWVQLATTISDVDTSQHLYGRWPTTCWVIWVHIVGSADSLCTLYILYRHLYMHCGYWSGDAYIWYTLKI